MHSINSSDTSSSSAQPRAQWRVRAGTIVLDRPIVMGIVNVTPDSFSDGGEYQTIESALWRVGEMRREGVDIVDVGGESTRPGARIIDEEEELRRVIPVVAAIRRKESDLLISVDTSKSEVARQALDVGANIINDVSGLRFDSAVADVCAEYQCGLVIMHSRGRAGEIASYEHAEYDGNVVGAVERELLESVARATERGVHNESVVIDPGVGFAKRSEHSVQVLRGLPRLAGLGFPVLVGASRKRVIASLTGVDGDAASRLFGTLGVHVSALALGARIFRVHDVRAHREALDAAWAVVRSDEAVRDASKA